MKPAELNYRASGKVLAYSMSPSGLAVILVLIREETDDHGAEYCVSTYWPGETSWNSGRYTGLYDTALKFYLDKVRSVMSEFATDPVVREELCRG